MPSRYPALYEMANCIVEDVFADPDVVLWGIDAELWAADMSSQNHVEHQLDSSSTSVV